MGKGLRKKGHSDFLNKLNRDCITFRLKESDALQYIQKEFGEPISKRGYWYRRRKVLNNDAHKDWLNWFSRVGFISSHFQYYLI